MSDNLCIGCGTFPHRPVCSWALRDDHPVRPLRTFSVLPDLTVVYDPSIMFPSLDRETAAKRLGEALDASVSEPPKS